jgi:hypothetical protein
VVLGPKGEPDTKSNLSTDRWSWDKLNSTPLRLGGPFFPRPELESGTLGRLGRN